MVQYRPKMITNHKGTRFLSDSERYYHCNRCEYDIPKVWLKNIVGFHAISAAYYWVDLAMV